VGRGGAAGRVRLSRLQVPRPASGEKDLLARLSAPIGKFVRSGSRLADGLGG
jgi:hypothetical protein